jgi:hypothetical protein
MDELDPIYYLIRGVERDGLRPLGGSFMKDLMSINYYATSLILLI